MPEPLVSVVVPAYNQAEYLSACLDSLWFQDYPAIEIVVVNDGATDDTPQVIEAFQKDVATLTTSFASRYDAETNQLERTWHPVYPSEGRSLRVVTHEQNRRLAPALNTGVAASTGTYVTYVPCDDLAYPHMLSTLVEA